MNGSTALTDFPTSAVVEGDGSTARVAAATAVYAAEGLASVAANLMQSGIFFYTAQQFGWGLSRNLSLASGQGAVYVVGALLAGKVSGRWGPRRAIVAIEACMVLLAAGSLLLPRPATMTLFLLAYAAMTGMQWPILESMASAGASGPALSRRLTAYNITWSGVNALTLAGSGLLIQAWPLGLFAVAAGAQLLTVGCVAFGPLPRATANAAGHGPAASHHPEGSLLRQRVEALWLSRIALPSSFVIVYSLGAMMPSLRLVKPLATHWRTLLGSGWFLARCLSFVGLGFSDFWHTRPRLLLLATAGMLAGFLGTVLTPADLFGFDLPWAADLAMMLFWQIVLGLAMGLIYSGSLYFGMVLSDGSTEHGGYHEALIGLGATLGPAAAALAHTFQPNGVTLSSAAVGGIIGASLIVSMWVARRSHRSIPSV